MRDAGLDRAIEAAGGVAELARQIGIAQPSVSNWNRVPAQRVIAVEAATGVLRECLRPDLYSVVTPEDGVVDPIDMARSREYAAGDLTVVCALGCDAPADRAIGRRCNAARACSCSSSRGRSDCRRQPY